MSEERAWRGTTYGNSWLHKQLMLCVSLVPLRILYAFAALFVVPVCMIVNKTGVLIYRYLRRHHHMSGWKAFWGSYKNHCLFSQVVIDRFAVYAGKEFDIRVEGYEYYEALAKKPDSFIQLSAHIGNYEMAGYKLVAHDKPLNVLVLQEEKAFVMENRKKQFRSALIKMIGIGDDMDYVFEIEQALSRGEIVSMPADRIIGSKRTLSAKFLYEKAAFPLGPFRICTAIGAEALCISTMKTKRNQYTVYVKPLQYDKSASRNEQVKQLLHSYISELEQMVKRFPYQWYNYYEFWI